MVQLINLGYFDMEQCVKSYNNLYGSHYHRPIFNDTKMICLMTIHEHCWDISTHVEFIALPIQNYSPFDAVPTDIISMIISKVKDSGNGIGDLRLVAKRWDMASQKAECGHIWTKKLLDKEINQMGPNSVHHSNNDIKQMMRGHFGHPWLRDNYYLKSIGYDCPTIKSNRNCHNIMHYSNTIPVHEVNENGMVPSAFDKLINHNGKRQIEELKAEVKHFTKYVAINHDYDDIKELESAQKKLKESDMHYRKRYSTVTVKAHKRNKRIKKE